MVIGCCDDVSLNDKTTKDPHDPHRLGIPQ